MNDLVPKKHAGGRPTKYTPAYIDKAEEYITTCGREQTKLPTQEGLAHYLGIDVERVISYSNKFPEFGKLVTKVKELQKEQLINDGMYGGKEVNAAMAIFLLKAHHGLMESSRLDITSGGKPLIDFDLLPKTQVVDGEISEAKSLKDKV